MSTAYTTASYRQVPPEIRNMSHELLAVRYHAMMTGEIKLPEAERQADRTGFWRGVIIASAFWAVLWGMTEWHAGPDPFVPEVGEQTRVVPL